MGFHQSTGGSRYTYASFADGKIVLRSKEPREGYTARVNKIGNTVYEQMHEEFTGYLRAIEARENDYGSQWCFTFEDAPEKYIITDRLNGSYAKSIISALASADYDPNEKITVAPWRMDDPKGGDKYIVGAVVKQRGQKLARKYCSPNTPEDKRNGATPLPVLKEMKVSGKMVYDDTDQIEFLTGVVATINGRLGATPAEALPSAPSAPVSEALPTAPSTAKPSKRDNPSDVPF